MYKKPTYRRTLLKTKNSLEGERIEVKVRRMITNKEPIKDGAPLIFTERKDGVNAAYNIRTDRWEIATDAMTKILKSQEAKRDEIIKKAEQAKADANKEDAKVIDINKDNKVEPTPGKADTNKSQSK